MRATLNDREERRIARGHLWAYRSEIQKMPEAAQDGDIIDLMTGRGKFIARGFYQSDGAIAVRVLSRHQDSVDAAFFEERIKKALALRTQLFAGEHSYRWIHAESDGLPGLTADRYGSVVSARTASGFYSAHAAEIIAAFMDADGVSGVRFDCCGAIHKEGDVPDTVTVQTGGIDFDCSLVMGQKTGFYLDQRENAKMIDAIAPDARVLDAYCYVGQWAVRAAKAGAAFVHAVDSSQPALEFAQLNADRAGVGDRVQIMQDDVETIWEKASEYDVVCLDPPPLAKARRQLAKSMTLYQALNKEAMRVLNPEGGYLITSSCSHLVDPPAFEEMLKRAARSAKKQAVILQWSGPPADHPQLLAMPETRYLNCALLRVWEA